MPSGPDPATDTELLFRLLGSPELSRLVARTREHLESGGDPGGSVSVASPTEAERLAVARLLGRRPTKARSLRVRLGELEAVLVRAGAASTLREALAALGGPLQDRVAARGEAARAWSEAHAPLEALVERRPVLAGWLDSLRARGLLKRLSASDAREARRLAEQAAAVVAALPAGDLPRSVLAAREAGSGHGLDDDRPLSTLVLGAAGALTGLEPGPDAASRRALWEAVGVRVGGLEAPVLVLGLRGGGAGTTARVLERLAEAGEPSWLTARQLERAPLELSANAGPVFACENTCVVSEAATRLGAASPPLICLGGHPSSAGLVLLEQLAAAGCEVRYHGDFDWGGLTIAERLVARGAVRPWRLGRADYQAALPGARRRLTGRAVDASWDAALADAMSSAGLAVEEELVLDELLADLARAGQDFEPD